MTSSNDLSGERMSRTNLVLMSPARHEIQPVKAVDQ